jgi:hypothetical protein
VATTLWFDEMIDLLKPFSVDVAMLPINGNKPERKVAGNLNCKEAAALGKSDQCKICDSVSLCNVHV